MQQLQRQRRSQRGNDIIVRLSRNRRRPEGLESQQDPER
jgi:hypothetical protein